MYTQAQIKATIQNSSTREKIELLLEDAASALVEGKELLNDEEIEALEERVPENELETYNDLSESVDILAGSLAELKEVLDTMTLNLAVKLGVDFANFEQEKLSPEESAKIQEKFAQGITEMVQEISMVKAALKSIEEYALELGLLTNAVKRIIASIQNDAQSLLDGLSTSYADIPVNTEMYEEYGQAIRKAKAGISEEYDEDEDEDEDFLCECEDECECCSDE